jgi:hypothetical protein
MFSSRKWLTKYKKSINCRRPKGFSQRQHCKYGRGTRKKRRTRRTKNLQRGGNAETERIIREIFSEEIYDVIYDPVKNMCDIYNKNHTGYDGLCIAFSIKESKNMIYIDTLSKCIASGTNTLEKMDSLAKKLNIGELQLFDGSSIQDCGVKVNLSKLQILSTGESWYNSKGYQSPEYHDEKESNKLVLEKNAIEFINECLETERRRQKIKDPTIRYKQQILGLTENLEIQVDQKKREDLQKRIVTLQQSISEYNKAEEEQKIDNEINKIRSIFNNGILFTINESMTVQSYFQNMKTQLLAMASSDESTKCDKYRFASKLLDIIGSKGDVKYSNSLTKRVTP